MPVKVGITGSFGAGKTTVAAMFRSRGARVIDADALAHALLGEDAACIREVRKIFGAGMIGSKGVDRIRLGQLVFADPCALKKLEAILHPRLRRMIRREIFRERNKERIVVLDAAILIEAGWHTLMDVVIVVKSRQDVQIKRVMARTGLSRADVLRRIRRQMPLSEKKKHAAYMIDNSGSSAITEKHVERIFRSLSKLRQHPSNRRAS